MFAMHLRKLDMDGSLLLQKLIQHMSHVVMYGKPLASGPDTKSIVPEHMILAAIHHAPLLLLYSTS